MITQEIVLVLIALAFMIIMLTTQKIPYGVTTMTCCAFFVLTGVCDMSTAFSGLSNSTTILVATMLVVATALGKTSIIHRLREKMYTFQNSKGIFLVLILFVFTAALSQIMGQNDGVRYRTAQSL